MNQLFSIEEILQRLAQARLKGWLHVFTQTESVNIYIDSGYIIGATRGQEEGESVLQAILRLPDARGTWLQDVPPLVALRQPLKLEIQNYLIKLSMARDVTSVPVPPAPSPASAAASGVSTSHPLPSPLPFAPPPVASASITSTKGLSMRDPEREAKLLAKYKLVLVSTNPPMRIPIPRVSNLVGRSEGSELMVPHDSVSRRHCLMQITERGLHIKDLGSANGTMINGTPVNDGFVKPGETLRLGHLDLLLQNEA